jgi:hypothetical protein
LIPSPILRALSTIRRHRVVHLLMGGQACVLYGAAEFSRDLDLVLLPDPANLDRLNAALGELQAEVIAVPPFSLKHLTEGLAVHFRCRQPEVAGLRIDVMSQLRGVEPFSALWARRTTFAFDDETLEVLSLPDLVAAKKTQRDKDWPMIRRLVDASYLGHMEETTPERVEFWLLELRSPELLVGAVERHPAEAERLGEMRPLLRLANPKELEDGALARALREEEDAERRRDAEHWKGLRQELERLRRTRGGSTPAAGH